jgi:hypothetical protein
VAVLLKVLGLEAASMLLMKMPPLPLVDGTMQEMSYSKVPSFRFICLIIFYKWNSKGSETQKYTSATTFLILSLGSHALIS